MRAKVIYIKYSPNFISHLERAASNRLKKDVVEIDEDDFNSFNEICHSYHQYTMYLSKKIEGGS